MQQEKCYDRARDGSRFQLVTRPNDIDPYDDDPNTLRAVVSCGHVVTPSSMTAWCDSLLEQGRSEFSCPVERCGKVWSYEEVRKFALLTPDERQKYELTLARVSKKGELQSCPGCRMLTQRSDHTNLCVKCILCSAKKNKTYEFCWQCQREWIGIRPRSDRCGNNNCFSDSLKLLQNCVMVPLVAGISCPSVRACPTCGTLVEHNKKGCKNVKCTNCKKDFCFLCLKLTSDCQKLKPGSWYEACASAVAPRQTSIPQ